MSTADFFATLSPEELKEAKAFVEYRRNIPQGHRPIIGATKGSKTKLLTSETSSVVDFVNEIVSSDFYVASSVPDLRAKAKLRGFKARNKMLSYQGDSWKSDLVAEYLQISIQMVSRKRSQGKILGLSYNRAYIYPCWQFEANKILPGLELILSILETELVPDWDKLRFFTTADDRLSGLTPVEALQQGKLEEVVNLAKVYGTQQS